MSTNATDRGVRRRRSASAARAEAIAAGQRLLLAGGPQALTLKAVGAAIGMTHANLIHHFGSAECFQNMLRSQMLESLTRSVAAAIEAQDGRDVRAVVDTVFEAYAASGIGHLMAWSALHRIDEDGDGPINAVKTLLGVIEPTVEGDQRSQRARALVALVTALALADSLVGEKLGAVLGDTGAMRRLTAAIVDWISRSDEAVPREV